MFGLYLTSDPITSSVTSCSKHVVRCTWYQFAEPITVTIPLIRTVFGVFVLIPFVRFSWFPKGGIMAVLKPARFLWYGKVGKRLLFLFPSNNICSWHVSGTCCLVNFALYQIRTCFEHVSSDKKSKPVPWHVRKVTSAKLGCSGCAPSVSRTWAGQFWYLVVTSVKRQNIAKRLNRQPRYLLKR